MNPFTELEVPIQHPGRVIFLGGEDGGRAYLEEQTHAVVDTVGRIAVRKGASLLRGSTPLFSAPWTTQDKVDQFFSLRQQLKYPISLLADSILAREHDPVYMNSLSHLLNAAQLYCLIDIGGKEFGRHYDLDFNIDPNQITQPRLVAAVDAQLKKHDLINGQQTIADGKIQNLESIGTWLQHPEKETLFGWEASVENTETPGLTKVSIRSGKWMDEEHEFWSAGKFLIDADVNADFNIVGELPIDLRGRHGLSTDSMRWKVVEYDQKRGILIVRPIVSTFSSEDLKDTTIRFPRTDDITKQLPVYLNLATRALVQSISFGFEIEDPEADMLPELSPELMTQAFAENPKLSHQMINRMRTAFHLDPQKATEICYRLGLFKVSPFLSKLSPDQVQQLIAEMPDAKTHFEYRRVIGDAYNPFINMANLLSDFGVAELDGRLGWGLLTILFHDAPGFEKIIRKTQNEKITAELMKYLGLGIKEWIKYTY